MLLDKKDNLSSIVKDEGENSGGCCRDETLNCGNGDGEDGCKWVKSTCDQLELKGFTSNILYSTPIN